MSWGEERIRAFGIVFALAGDHRPLGLVIKVAKQNLKSKFSEAIDGSLGTEAMALRTAEILLLPTEPRHSLLQAQLTATRSCTSAWPLLQ